MNRLIQFSTEAKEHFDSGSGWFEFNPVNKLNWSFEETLARILGAFPISEHDAILTQDDKSCFCAYGLLNGFPFRVYDWREDRCIHVGMPNHQGEPPKGFRKSEFVHAFKMALSKVKPEPFCLTSDYNEEIISWPPTPLKVEAVGSAIDALERVLITGSNKLPKTVIKAVFEAHADLERAFR